MVIPELLQDWAAVSAEPQTRSPCCSMKIRLKILKAMQLTMMTKSPKYSLGTRGKPVGRGQKPPSQVLHQRQLNQVKKRQCVPELCCNSVPCFCFSGDSDSDNKSDDSDMEDVSDAKLGTIGSGNPSGSDNLLSSMGPGLATNAVCSVCYL